METWTHLHLAPIDWPLLHSWKRCQQAINQSSARPKEAFFSLYKGAKKQSLPGYLLGFDMQSSVSHSFQAHLQTNFAQFAYQQ